VAEAEAAADKPHTCVPSCIAVGYLGPCGFLKVFARLVQSHTHTHKKKKADYNAELTKEILDIVSRLQDFYSNPLIYLPFRLPSLAD